VGDAHYAREEWPTTQRDWENLWSLNPHPIRLTKIVYSVNKERKVFDAISFRFAGQTFKSYEMSATEHHKRLVCPVKLRHGISTVKIKQRNSIEGISMICGLWLICRGGQDAAKIDLCPGLGQWRLQRLNPRESIIGIHSYLVADDESISSEQSIALKENNA